MSMSGTEFMDGGGEAGKRIRALDWSATPLGPAYEWPQSLKTIVRVMLDSRFAMWMAWGPELNFFCNDAYLPTLGIKGGWALGRKADIVWEEIWHDIGPRIQHVLSTGEATWDEGLRLFLRRSGYDEETFHTFSYSPVYDDASRVAGMLCVVVEDTEKVISERRLRMLRDLAATATRQAESAAAAGRLMLAAVDTAAADVPFAALYLTDPASGNPVLAGGTVRLLADRLPAVLEPSTTACPIVVAVRSALASGEAQWLESLHSLADERPITGLWPEPVRQAWVVPLRNAGRANPLGALVLGVSTRRQFDAAYNSFFVLVADQFSSQLADLSLRLEAEQRAHALAELDRAKNLFFSNVSHEFRTPLTLMIGPLDKLLANRDLPPALREPVEMMHRNGVRLRKLVDALLDFSRIEAGRVETRYRPTDLAALTTDLAAAFRSAVEGAGLRLSVHCEALPEPAYVDRDMWEKVVLNLLSNAFKFTFDGEIEVTLTHVGGEARLVVRDTGVGIEAESLPMIFDRFHRVTGARSRSQEGSGIGLALVKELVKLHGGNVSASSEPGQGTAVTVTIPLGRQHLRPERIELTTDTAAASAVDRSGFVQDALRSQPARPSVYEAGVEADAGARRSRHPGPVQRVLVVDDNADMRVFIGRLLEPYWQVETAADGAEALACIEQAPPDLVVTDMMMPNVDGRGLIQAIRTAASTPSMPIIVLSAQAGEEARVAGLNQGADDYLVKPFAPAELVARVELQLTRSWLRRAEEDRNRQIAGVFQHAPVGVAMLRGPSHVFEFSNATHSAFLYDRPIVGLPIREVIPEFEGQGIYELLDAVRETREPFSGHAVPLKLRDADGVLQQRYFEFVFQPLDNDPGADDTIVAIGLDVTELISARLAAESASLTKDQFIAVLGHELRNPLAPITTALELMRAREPEVSVRERDIIERQVGHMTRLVDDLLDVARITRGNLELKKSVVELASIVDKALETASPLFETKRQRISVQAQRAGLPVIADPTRLSQVVANLLINASKFTPDGGSIEVRVNQLAGDAVVEVNDTGRGLAPNELETVFELFVQGQQELHRPQGGLGLGLSIARNLAQLHGASISASSPGPEQGSTFSLRMPLAESLAPNAPLRSGVERVPQRPAGSPARSVLLVDDNVDAAETLGDLLTALGHKVTLAYDGPGALKLVAAGCAVDVALLDIGLPVMDGHELAGQLRATAGGPAMRLIALSGFGQAGDIARSRQSGFDEHLTKPVDVARLIRAIDGE